jgi:hypothetical protein
MIEHFDLKYTNFFDQTDYFKRWQALKAIYSEDYWSYRVLFCVEVLALIDKWQEPSKEDLQKFLEHLISGGQFATHIGNIKNLLLPVWPLEMAKYDVLIYRTLLTHGLDANYPLTTIKAASTSLVQTWWAFETLMNDFASIIVEQRKANISQTEKLLLDDKNVLLGEKGEIQERLSYQPIAARIQFIFRFLTGTSIDRSGDEWRNLMNLKNARDIYVHRFGKEGGTADVFDEKIIFEGLKSVQKVIADVFTKTPEFAERFIYKFLSFWSCGTDAPFIWDGKCGEGFYLGLTELQPENIIGLFAPMPSSFSGIENV